MRAQAIDAYQHDISMYAVATVCWLQSLQLVIDVGQLSDSGMGRSLGYWQTYV